MKYWKCAIEGCLLCGTHCCITLLRKMFRHFGLVIIQQAGIGNDHKGKSHFPCIEDSSSAYMAIATSAIITIYVKGDLGV